MAGYLDGGEERPRGTLEHVPRLMDHASLRNALAFHDEPGNELPGYFRLSRWDNKRFVLVKKRLHAWLNVAERLCEPGDATRAQF